MSYFAAAVVRGSEGWTASQVSLTGVSDVEDVADRLREVAPEADVSLLFVESDDAYLAVLRLDEGEDLRIFGSDATFAEESRLGALLLGEIEEHTPDLLVEPVEEEAGAATDVEQEPAARVLSLDEPEPVGDADLLADLGVPATQLLTLCAREGMLPSDVTAEICQAIGCGDEVEELREA